MQEWTIRSILSPVIARLTIYGVNPIDIENVMCSVENQNLINSRLLEKVWLEEWEKKALRYKALGEDAESKNNSLSAQKFYLYAARCYYAVFLINLRDIEEKKRIYEQYALLYKKSIEYCSSEVEYIDMHVDNNSVISGYLHRPVNSDSVKSPCVVIFTGLGSCKEEMHTLARPLAERGIAAFVLDMPGCGESLFMRGVKCRVSALNSVFTGAFDYLTGRNDIKGEAIGTYGLCMGGGYAHRAACFDKRYSFCVTLFPLFINQVVEGATPQWMKQGEWYNYQTGNIPSDEFMREMKDLESGRLTCPYLFVHGKHDNWMAIDTASELYEKAGGKKEKLIIEEVPVYSNQQLVTHTMPVGEQLHWIKHIAADWICAIS